METNRRRPFEMKLQALRRKVTDLVRVSASAARLDMLAAQFDELLVEYQVVAEKLVIESLLREVEQRLSKAGKFAEIGQFLVDFAVRHTDGQRGFLLVKAGRAGSMHRVVTQGLDEKMPEKGPSSAVVRYVMETQEPIHSALLQADERFVKGASTISDRGREVLAIPIPGPDGASGVLYVDCLAMPEGQKFTMAHLNLLQQLAEPVRLAIDKADLVEALITRAAEAERKSTAGSNLDEEVALRLRRLLEVRGQPAEMVQRLLNIRAVGFADLDRAIQISRKENLSLTRVLLQEKMLSAAEFIRFVQSEMRIPYVSVQSYLIDPSIVALVPRQVCEKYVVIPLNKIDKVLTLAMLDPLDPFVLDHLTTSLSCSIRPVIAAEEEIRNAIARFHGRSASATGPADAGKNVWLLDLVRRSNAKLDALRKSDAAALGSSISELVALVLESAVRMSASDVHINSGQSALQVRYRIDGALLTVMEVERRFADSFVSSVKVMSSIDIAEHRLPQDGKAVFAFGTKTVDLRVSTFPTVMGEELVIRILDRDTVYHNMDALGIEPAMLMQLKRLIQRPNGMFLVTGPTGSGKSTTLYAVVSQLNAANRKVITLEDPVEFSITNVSQAQVNPKIGFDFATGLRSILRQDPDIILVGEVRDDETAEIAVRAALTGHLVLSTLHTNDSAGAVTRLMDMGIDGFRLGETVLGILGQRLIRRICPTCKERHTPESHVFKGLDLTAEERSAAYFHGGGCPDCNQTGYQGRVAIHELLVMNVEIRRLIFSSKDPDQIRSLALSQGLRTLRADGMSKAVQGLTTLDEVLLATAG